MQYGYFDNERREYVIDKVDIPASWTNYLGTEDMVGVVNHTAGGYLFYKSAEYHRITRFRPNGVPADRPGHYIYLRDDETGEYWSVSWQPVGLPLTSARYTCRHGLSYSVYECEYAGVLARQTLFIPRGEDVELWDFTLENRSGKNRSISVFSYAEFSFHHIDMDNRNFQMSLYAAGARYADGIIEQELHYENKGFQYFTADFAPDSFDTVRDSFIGPYRTEKNPLGVEKGMLDGKTQNGGNQCAGLHKRFILAPGDTLRACFMLGEGNAAKGRRVREKFSTPESRGNALRDLAAFWAAKLDAQQVDTPSGAMNTMLNIWTLYQSEVNVMFSRFASFIEVSMTVQHSNPEKCRQRILQLLNGLTKEGYGLHLFEPEWFEERKAPAFKSPTLIPTPDADSLVHGLKDACSDDALWLVPSIVEYIRETGDDTFADEHIPYADAPPDTIYDHMKTILDFSARMVGKHGVCQGLRADWNDCLNLGGGESALVSFLHVWALEHFVELADHLGRTQDAEYYRRLRGRVMDTCEKTLWDGEWYLRGFTASGRPIGTAADSEGRVHLESNAWAVLSGCAGQQRGEQAMDAVKQYLMTPWGIRLNAPAYTAPDDEIGFVARVYPGLKENSSIFSHSNPWAWAAECRLGRGERAMEMYDALCPYNQNNAIETRLAEPYSYCQFISGPDHALFGEAHHPFMTGSAGWSYYAATRFMLGIRPQFDHLLVDPCIPAGWDGFAVSRRFRGAQYNIRVENPQHVSRGIAQVYVNGAEEDVIPVLPKGSTAEVRVVMGSQAGTEGENA